MKNRQSQIIILFKVSSVTFNLLLLVILSQFYNDTLAAYVAIQAFSIVYASVIDAGENNLNLNRNIDRFIWKTNFNRSHSERLLTLALLLTTCTLFVYFLSPSSTHPLSIAFNSLSVFIFMRIRTIYWREDHPIKSILLGETLPALTRMIGIPICLYAGIEMFYGFTPAILIGLLITKKTFHHGLMDLLPFNLHRRSLPTGKPEFKNQPFLITYFTSILLAVKDQITSIFIVELPASSQTFMVFYTRALTLINLLSTPKLADINRSANKYEIQTKKDQRKPISLSLVMFGCVILANSVTLGLSSYGPFNSTWRFSDGFVASLSLLSAPFVTFLLARGKSLCVLILTILITLFNIFWWT